MSLHNWFGHGEIEGFGSGRRDESRPSGAHRSGTSRLRRKVGRRHAGCSVESLEIRQFLSVNNGISDALLLWAGSAPAGQLPPAPSGGGSSSGTSPTESPSGAPYSGGSQPAGGQDGDVDDQLARTWAEYRKSWSDWFLGRKAMKPAALIPMKRISTRSGRLTERRPKAVATNCLTRQHAY